MMKNVLVELEHMCTDVNENQRKEDMEKTRVQVLTNIANKIEPKLKVLNIPTHANTPIHQHTHYVTVLE